MGDLCKKMESLKSDFNKSFETIRNGAVGVLGAGYAMQRAVAPADEFARAMGGLRSLGVGGEDLRLMEEASKRFTSQFGGDAKDIVNAAYDIQSSMGNFLKEGDLAKFTEQGAILAKATKADVATITGYQSTMFASFKEMAKTLGNDKLLSN